MDGNDKRNQVLFFGRMIVDLIDYLNKSLFLKSNNNDYMFQFKSEKRTE